MTPTSPDVSANRRAGRVVLLLRASAVLLCLAAPAVVTEYRTGSVVVFDSYRLHQIQPFDGARDRITATVHAAEIDPGRWETWF